MQSLIEFSFSIFLSLVLSFLLHISSYVLFFLTSISLQWLLSSSYFIVILFHLFSHYHSLPFLFFVFVSLFLLLFFVILTFIHSCLTFFFRFSVSHSHILSLLLLFVILIFISGVWSESVR